MEVHGEAPQSVFAASGSIVLQYIAVGCKSVSQYGSGRVRIKETFDVATARRQSCVGGALECLWPKGWSGQREQEREETTTEDEEESCGTRKGWERGKEMKRTKGRKKSRKKKKRKKRSSKETSTRVPYKSPNKIRLVLTEGVWTSRQKSSPHLVPIWQLQMRVFHVVCFVIHIKKYAHGDYSL